MAINEAKWYVRRGLPPVTRSGWEVTNRYGHKESYWFETEEWAQQCADTFNRLEAIAEKPQYIVATTNGSTLSVPYHAILQHPEHFEWICHLFGSHNNQGISYRPVKGAEPNAFQRWMMKVCFGCRWEKV